MLKFSGSIIGVSVNNVDMKVDRNISDINYSSAYHFL